MTVTIISACYGDYDDVLAPSPQTIDVDWLMVTDGPERVPDGWQVINEPRPHLHPRMAAKVPKCRPDWYCDSAVTIWVDASAVLAPTFAEWCVRGLGGDDLAQFAHPQRDDIADEAVVSATMTKYQGQPVLEQSSHYAASGLPRHFGLWATGVIVRRPTDANARLGADWLAEQSRWTYQDQISEPFLLWLHGLRPALLPGYLWGNPHVGFRAHRSEL